MAQTDIILSNINDLLKNISQNHNEKLDEIAHNHSNEMRELRNMFINLSNDHLVCKTSISGRIGVIEDSGREYKDSWWKRISLITGFVLLGVSSIGANVYNTAMTDEAVRGIRNNIIEQRVDINMLAGKVEKNIRDIAILEGRR